MFNNELEVATNATLDYFNHGSDNFKVYLKGSSLIQSSKSLLNELISEKSQESNSSATEESDIYFHSSEDDSGGKLANFKKGILELNLACQNIDAQWEALSTQFENDQEVRPFPSRGRRFKSQDAKSNVSICSRLSDKPFSAELPKLKASGSVVAAPSADEQWKGSRAEATKPNLLQKKSKPPWRVQPIQRPPISINRDCTSKPIIAQNSKSALSTRNEMRDSRKTGYKVSVLVWRNANRGDLENSLKTPPVSNNDVDECNQNDKIRTFTTKRETRRVKSPVDERKAFETTDLDRQKLNKTNVVESYLKQLPSQVISFSNVQSMTVNNLERNVDKLSFCLTCGLRLETKALEHHVPLCKRLKVVELQLTNMTNNAKKAEEHYQILSQETKTASTLNFKTGTRPYCSEHLEI